MSHRLLLGLLAASLVACTSPGEAPKCGFSTKVTLPSTPLTTADDLRIQRVGEGFLLTSGSSSSPKTSLARSSSEGELGPVVESTAYAYLGLAAVGKDSAADQIVVLDRAPGDKVVAAVIDEETGLPGPAHEVLTAGYHGQVIEVGTASSLDGRRAIYAHGNRIVEDPQAIVLGGDAERRGEPIVVKTGPDQDWDCLDVIPTASAAAISVVESRSGRRLWHVVELDAEGAQIFEGSVDLTEELDDARVACPTYIAVTKGGFAALLGGAIEPPIVFELDRATFGGSTRVTLSVDDEPAARASAMAAMGEGHAVQFAGGAAGSKPIRFFDRSGQALGGDIAFPAGFGVGGPLHTTAGSFLFQSRAGDGTWGWLEATCSDE
jgi:hypothetical protein